jgi:hypothetical protein
MVLSASMTGKTGYQLDFQLNEDGPVSSVCEVDSASCNYTTTIACE